MSDTKLNIDVILNIPNDKLTAILGAIDNRDLEVIYANGTQSIKNKLEAVLLVRAVELLVEFSASVVNADPRLIEHSHKNLLFIVSKLYQQN